MGDIVKNDWQECLEQLSDRIESIERNLMDDEEFCQSDIDGIYQAAAKHVRSIEEALNKKLEHLKEQLNRYREENLQTSKKNKEIFEQEIAQMNQLFCNEQQAEALNRFHQYEQQFVQRPTVIRRLPKLRLETIDVDQLIGLESESTALKNVQSSPLLEQKLNHSNLRQRLNSKSSENISKQAEHASERPVMIPSPVKTTRQDSLTLMHVCHYQHEQNLRLKMAATADYILLGKSQSIRFDQRSLTIIERQECAERLLPWEDKSMVSMGFIDQDRFYVFSEDQLIIYSAKTSQLVHTYSLPLKDTDYPFSCITGAMDHDHIYYIHRNDHGHWILSIVDRTDLAWIRDYDLTKLFPEVQRFVYLAIDDRTIEFLVELFGSRYAVQFCALGSVGSLIPKALIRLVYAEKPSSLCSIFVPTLKNSFIVVNDPAGRILHLLTHDKYLQSYPQMAFAICYVQSRTELLLATSIDICSINLSTHEAFFSKFARDSMG